MSYIYCFICVTGFTIEPIILLTSFILRPSLSIDVLLLQLLTTIIASFSSVGVKNMLFLFLEVK